MIAHPSGLRRAGNYVSTVAQVYCVGTPTSGDAKHGGHAKSDEMYSRHTGLAVGCYLTANLLAPAIVTGVMVSGKAARLKKQRGSMAWCVSRAAVCCA